MPTDHSAMFEQDLSLDDLLSGTFNSVMRIEEKALDNRLTRGLTITEIHTIAAIGLYDENPMSVAADKLSVTLATLTSSVNKLEKQGFVKKRRSAEDRRCVLLSLTKRGREVYRAHRLFHEKMIAAALSDLTPQEEEVLARSMRQIKAFFDEQNELAELQSNASPKRAD